MKIWLLIIFLIFQVRVYSQELLPEKFAACDAPSFLLESDTTVARISDDKLIAIIVSGFEKNVKTKIAGVLQMQIIVDSNGNSCLLSIKNKTNIKTEALNLKNTIDQKLKWNRPMQGVSTLVVLYFEATQISLKRFGYSSEYGWQEISDKIMISDKASIIKKNTNKENNPRIFEDEKTSSVWKHYNLENSMIPDEDIRSIKIDSKGIVWACTDMGVVRIDGDSWTIFDADNSTLTKNNYGSIFITTLQIDSKDRIWVVSWGEINIFDGVKWTKYDTTNAPIKSLKKIYIDKNGTDWFATFSGLVKYENNSWTKYNTSNSILPSNDISDVFLDKKNVLWIGTSKGLVTFSNDNWKVYNTENSSLPSSYIVRIEEDYHGNIWLAASGSGQKGGLIKIDTMNQWTIIKKENSRLGSNEIWEITAQKDIVWVGVYASGLLRIEGGNWEIYNSTNSIVPNFVYSIAIDSKGNKWIGTNNGLIYTTR